MRAIDVRVEKFTVNWYASHPMRRKGIVITLGTSKNKEGVMRESNACLTFARFEQVPQILTNLMPLNDDAPFIVGRWKYCVTFRAREQELEIMSPCGEYASKGF